MTDTTTRPEVRSGEVIPAGEPDLPTLARQINAEHDAVRTALLSGAQRAISAGKLLLKAKALVRFGQWEDWVAANTKLSDRVAVRYMSLASGENLLLTKAPNLADLTMTDAVKLLEDLKAPEERKIATGGRIKKAKKDPLTEAIKSTPLAVLERAWEECSDNERALFRRKKLPEAG
jgi:hypothetical protein